MSNVVHLTFPSRASTRADALAALVDGFARHRRIGDDVFWLKENAELLNILECTGAAPDQAALLAHREFHDTIVQRLSFFPQYYRFLLSICLDLEDMGLAGGKGEALVNWVADQGLAEAELSDLQRAEARRLMLRRGRDPMAGDAGLDERLHGFISRSATWTMPNKKAAYELTHIVFYLSEYGRRDPNLTKEAKKSLIFAGTLSYLDQNADLLAEICVALRYAGCNPPAIWEDWLQGVTDGYAVMEEERGGVQDDYHEYLVLNWSRAVAGGRAFDRTMPVGRIGFHRPLLRSAPLREMSETLFRLGDARNADWAAMRGAVTAEMAEDALDVLAEAEGACADAGGDFAEFFAGFARPGLSVTARPTAP